MTQPRQNNEPMGQAIPGGQAPAQGHDAQQEESTGFAPAPAHARPTLRPDPQSVRNPDGGGIADNQGTPEDRSHQN